MPLFIQLPYLNWIELRMALHADMIKQREIHLAVPANTNTAQRQQLQRVVEYGKSRNVQIKITEIK